MREPVVVNITKVTDTVEDLEEGKGGRNYFGSDGEFPMDMPSPISPSESYGSETTAIAY